jgi:hypothetical protein
MTEIHGRQARSRLRAGRHGHDHHHESYAARKHPEFVVLDIGGEKGALIVRTDAPMHGDEVEISPSEDDRRRSHKQVLERSINGQPAFTAVFDDLTAGTYTLWTEGRARARGVRIEGGAIAHLDWRAGCKDEARQAPAAGTAAGKPAASRAQR